MIGAVFFDIDGTLVTSEGKILDSTKKAIELLQEKKIPICLASGRARLGALWIIEELKITHPCMFHSGAEIYDPIARECLWSAYLTPDQVTTLINTCRTNGLYLELYSDSSYFVESENQLTHIHTELLGAPPTVCNFDELKLTFIKGVIVTDSKDKLELVKQLNLPGLKLGMAPGSKFENITFSNVTNENASRENAFYWFKKYLNLEGKDSIIFGDAISDIPFMKLCTFGIAMGNAEQIVKDHASLVTLPNDQDGIYHAISVLFPR
jgi:Cof subfamily protein (haloacid dehalogenase superfamily)